MICKSIVKMTVIIFGMIISFNLASFAQQTDKMEPDDKELVLKIYEKLKPGYDDQLRHINVRADASDGVVVVEGWVAKKPDVKKIVKLIQSVGGINCIVTAKLTVGKGIGCGPGQQECGGTCISSKDTCTVCLLQGKCN
ncbi:MAG: BON domain-containing protein [Pyrinomonadaceae bacterium]